MEGPPHRMITIPLPEGHTGSITPWKSEVRKSIRQQGFKIVFSQFNWEKKQLEIDVLPFKTDGTEVTIGKKLDWLVEIV